MALNLSDKENEKLCETPLPRTPSMQFISLGGIFFLYLGTIFFKT